MTIWFILLSVYFYNYAMKLYNAVFYWKVECLKMFIQLFSWLIDYEREYLPGTCSLSICQQPVVDQAKAWFQKARTESPLWLSGTVVFESSFTLLSVNLCISKSSYALSESWVRQETTWFQCLEMGYRDLKWWLSSLCLNVEFSIVNAQSMPLHIIILRNFNR